APPVVACTAPPLAAAMMSSCARTRSWDEEPAGTPIAATAPGRMTISIRCSSIRGGAQILWITQPVSSRSALRRKARMDHRTIAGERRRPYDFVVPIDGERFVLLVDEDFQKREKVSGVEARSGGGDAARLIAISDNFDAARVHDLVRPGQLAIAAALDREIDDHGARPHGSDH